MKILTIINSFIIVAVFVWGIHIDKVQHQTSADILEIIALIETSNDSMMRNFTETLNLIGTMHGVKEKL